MAVLAVFSRDKLLLDTLPAVKLTHWYGAPARDTVYTYGKLCLSPEGLRLGLTVFDGHPPETQRACAVLSRPESETALRLCFSPRQEVTAFCQKGGELQPLSAPTAVFSAGNDEQGWYWQAETLAGPELWQACGMPMPGAGEKFLCGFFLTDTGEPAFGSAFGPAQSERPGPDYLGEFIAVSY